MRLAAITVAHGNGLPSHRVYRVAWSGSRRCQMVNLGITLADGTVYVVHNSGKLHALDANTGQPRWSQPANLGRWRIHEQVAVAAGLVVLGSTYSQSLPQPDKAVMALDAATGAERWRTSLAVSQCRIPWWLATKSIWLRHRARLSR